jgi:glycogenin glucosyltransferase
MEAWVTLVTNDNYAVGALTLAASLKRVNSSKKLAIMITNTVSDNVKNTLEELFDDVIAVDEMDSGDIANLILLDRTELGITFTKVLLN